MPRRGEPLSQVIGGDQERRRGKLVARPASA